MVLYYSATGNTEYIAKLIVAEIEDDSIDLLARIRERDDSPIRSESPFIICSPVYVCDMPRFFSNYIRHVRLEGSRQVYFIFTSGGYSGIAGYQAAKIIRRKHMSYMGRADFCMPRNYPVSRRYPMLSDEENLKRIERSTKRVPDVTARIKRGERLRARYITLLEKIITMPFNPFWTHHMQTTDDFYTTDKCLGCGKCARLCPLNNIAMTDGQPRWLHACAHCMACLGNCPTEAIEYRGRTEAKPKYRIGKYVYPNSGLSLADKE